MTLQQWMAAQREWQTFDLLMAAEQDPELHRELRSSLRRVEPKPLGRLLGRLARAGLLNKREDRTHTSVWALNKAQRSNADSTN